MPGRAFVERGTSPGMMRAGIKSVQGLWHLSRLPRAGTLHPWTRPDKKCCFLSCTRHIALETPDSMFPRISGTSLEVTDACRACGRCVNIWPNDAIKIRIDDPDFLEESYRRIRKRVTFDGVDTIGGNPD